MAMSIAAPSLQLFLNSTLFNFTKSVPTDQTKKMVLASEVSHSHMVCHSTPRSQPGIQSENQWVNLPRCRIANWDKKRGKCNNCQHIYLKTLSKHPGFCSVDCKSNMVYLEKVNRTICAVKNAVQEQCRKKEQQREEPSQHETLTQEKRQTYFDDELEVETECKTFAEFGLESRMFEACNVEWASSAMY